jgi:putative NADH-flavin reductase
MSNHIKIAVLGGTGKSGKYLVQQLLKEGRLIKMLLRDPEKMQVDSRLIEIVEGDARDEKAVRLLVEGCQAVISTLGQPHGEPPIFSQATENVIRAMSQYGVRRYILITGLNVDAPLDKKSVKTTFATQWMKEHYPLTTADKQRELGVLSEGDIDWTLVRLPLIELTDQKRELKVNLEDCPGDKISATDLADFLIGQLSEIEYFRKCPFIANV